MLNGMEMLLSDSGHNVQAVSSGEAALAVIKDNPPELVITDIRMPGMTGLDLLAETKNALPSTSRPPFILISGSVPKEEVASLGVKAFLAKPFEAVELLEMVTAALKAQ